MIEVYGDLWHYSPADLRVITTNGFVKMNGQAVMGRGCAREAARMFTDLPLKLGQLIKYEGNKPFYFPAYEIATLPVKHAWYEKADIDLIVASCKSLVHDIVNIYGFEHVLIPRPGCGNGQLQWKDVKKALYPVLDKRFKIITWSKDDR